MRSDVCRQDVELQNGVARFAPIVDPQDRDLICDIDDDDLSISLDNGLRAADHKTHAFSKSEDL
jgi:hypothetical protein